MYILGIETSCDDTAAAVIEAKGGFNKPSFSVLANTSYSQVAIHKKFGGIVPNLASRAHLEKIIPTIKATLSILRIDSGKIDLIAVTKGPGLLPSLLIGVNTARALAYKWQKPIIGVNHIEGHIFSNWLPSKSHLPFHAFLARPGESRSGIRPRSSRFAGHPARFGLITRFEKASEIFPSIILIVSGGHTELVLMKDYGKYKIIGQTLDDAAGECFDKTARLLGLGFPGGPAIAAEAAKFKVQSSKFKVELPRPMINSKDYNFTFSGLKTAVLYLYNNLTAQDCSSNNVRSAMADEIQNAIIDVLTAKTVKAIENLNPKTVMICGGVSANKALRENMAEEFESYKIPFLMPNTSYTTDNAAMIATAGYFEYIQKKPAKDSWKNLVADANLRL